jgi:MFS family permease
VLGLYIIWALSTAHLAVDLKLLRHAQTALAVSLCTLVSVVLFVMVFLLPIFLEQVQGLSPLVAGLVLLPQGLVTGLGTVLGSRLAARRGVRFSALLGMVILTLSTLALLLVTITTPAGVTAVILSGRGLALGLTIQPLLDALIDGLSQAEVPDGNTLFNVAQRLGGSIGVRLLATFFGLRERVRVAQVLQVLGVASDAIKPGRTLPANLPAAVRDQIAQAAVTGFHDAIWLLVLLSALGVIAAMLLRDRRPEAWEKETGGAEPSLPEEQQGVAPRPDHEGAGSLLLLAAGHETRRITAPTGGVAKGGADHPTWADAPHHPALLAPDLAVSRGRRAAANLECAEVCGRGAGR